MKTKILGLFTALLLGQVLSAVPAAADHGYQRHYLKSATTDRCLVGQHIPPGGQTGWVGTWPCAADYRLVWQWTGHFGSWTGIQNVAEKTCLDTNGSLDMYVHACVGSANQYWVVSRNGHGYAEVKSKVSPHLCMQEAGADGAAQVRPCNRTDKRQWWRFVPRHDA